MSGAEENNNNRNNSTLLVFSDTYIGKVKDGKPLLLGDVAKILYAPPDMIGDAVINDGPGLMLIVEKFPWARYLFEKEPGVKDMGLVLQFKQGMKTPSAP